MRLSEKKGVRESACHHSNTCHRSRIPNGEQTLSVRHVPGRGQILDSSCGSAGCGTACVIDVEQNDDRRISFALLRI